jgi:hypothetical protein
MQIMSKKKMVGKNRKIAAETPVGDLGKYIRQLELDLGGLGYPVERERPIEVTEFLNRVAPVDPAYQKRFADRVGRPIWLMVRVTVKPKDSQSGSTMLETRFADSMHQTSDLRVGGSTPSGVASFFGNIHHD